MGAGIQPGHAAPDHLDAQLAPIQVDLVHVGDLQLAALARASSCWHI